MQTQGRLITPEQFGDIVLRANPDGSVLRIRDVARVELGAANMDTESRLNGNPAVSIGIYLAPGANAVQTSARVQAGARTSSRPASRRACKPRSSTTAAPSSRTRSTRCIKTLAEAFVLVVIVVFLFLGNLRATIIPTVAVPVSLIGTFAVLLAVGYSANTVSLLAMVLAIGIVVDDAIVVVENVERVMEEEPELTPAEATKKAMAQITAPIIAITLVLLSVFVPIGFIPGISGTLFRQFAVTISVAMLISAINALTLSPALCAVFLRHTGPAARHHGLGAARHRPRARRLCRGRAAPGARGGHRASCWSRRSAPASSAWAAITPTGFLPEEDQGAFFVAVQLPDGASVARTRAVAEQRRGHRSARCRRSRACCPSSASPCSTAATSRTPRSWWCG